MAIQKDISSITRGHSKLYVLAVGMSCVAGLWATVSMEAMLGKNQGDPKSPLAIEGAYALTLHS